MEAKLAFLYFSSCFENDSLGYPTDTSSIIKALRPLIVTLLNMPVPFSSSDKHILISLKGFTQYKPATIQVICKYMGPELKKWVGLRYLNKSAPVH